MRICWTREPGITIFARSWASISRWRSRPRFGQFRSIRCNFLCRLSGPPPCGSASFSLRNILRGSGASNRGYCLLPRQAQSEALAVAVKFDVARALFLGFFAQEGTPMEIKTIGVLGCGLMGSGIAQVAAIDGLETAVLEVKQKFHYNDYSENYKSLEY